MLHYCSVRPRLTKRLDVENDPKWSMLVGPYPSQFPPSFACQHSRRDTSVRNRRDQDAWRSETERLACCEAPGCADWLCLTGTNRMRLYAWAEL
jgi:hypothetical protein